tara:strand:- start:29 stop:955 length:927 start_codon:yes stop_codon:yes gene_type:complete
VDIKETLISLGYSNIQDLGNEYRTKPIYRESDSNTVLRIKKDTGHFTDFSRSISGTFEELVRLSLKLDKVEDAKKWLDDKSYYDAPRELYKPKLSHTRTFDESVLSKVVAKHEYWIDRGISISTIEQFKGGIIGAGKMNDRYVFPILNSRGQIVGVSGRCIRNSKSSARPKWKHIGQIYEWIYPAFLNINILKKEKQIILVESIGDMLALWDAGVKNVLVIFGLNMSSGVLNFLLKVDPLSVILALNNDDSVNLAGNKAAKKNYSKLIKYFDKNQVVIHLPTKNDFGEMDKEEISRWKKSLDEKIQKN